MEVPGSQDKKPLVAAYELIGTALFVYMILVSTGNALAVPIGLFAMIIVFGGLTGGHFNPAVTVGVYIHEGKWKDNAFFAALIVASQHIGALLGMLLASVTLGSTINDEWTIADHRVPILAPADPKGVDRYDMGLGEEGFGEDGQVCITQIVCTFTFVAVILVLKGGMTAPSKDGALQALTVALTLGGLIQVATRAAASFNPAVTVGLTVMQTAYLENKGGYLTHYFYAYYIGPLVGGILAGLFSRIHNPIIAPPAAKSMADDEEQDNLISNQAV